MTCLQIQRKELTYRSFQLERHSVSARKSLVNVMLSRSNGKRDAKTCLGGGNEDLSRLGSAQVMHDAHELGGLRASLLCLGHMQVHLVAVEVGVVRVAHALVEAERPAQAKEPFAEGQLTERWCDLRRSQQDRLCPIRLTQSTSPSRLGPAEEMPSASSFNAGNGVGILQVLQGH